ATQDATVTVRLILPPIWGTVTGALGGGPLLVRNGKAVFHTSENFAADQLAARDARAAVGQLDDGGVILVAVDGGQPGYSTGMTTYDLAQTMAQLGARIAVGLAYGKPVTAAFDGPLLSRPTWTPPPARSGRPRVEPARARRRRTRPPRASDAGTRSRAWDGDTATRGPAPAGRYCARVIALSWAARCRL